MRNHKHIYCLFIIKTESDANILYISIFVYLVNVYDKRSILSTIQELGVQQLHQNFGFNE